MNKEKTLEKNVRDLQQELDEVYHSVAQLTLELGSARDEIKRSRDFLQDVVDAFPDPLMVLDTDYHIILANRALGKIAGRDPVSEELKCYQVTHKRNTPCDDVESPCPLRLAIDDRLQVIIEHIHYDSMGNKRIMEVSAVPILNKHGETTMVIESEHDITELKNAKTALQKAHDELEIKVRKRTGELAEAYEKLKELDRMKSMFIASMSHELRTPLNSILGFTGIILAGMSGKINSRQRDQLNRVQRSAQHLLAMITDVIDISRIESGRMEVSPEEIHLDSLINEAIENVKPQLENKGLALEVSVPRGLKIDTDRRRLLQCIINLLGNAVKFTEAGTIRIDAKEINGAVEISVSDTGIGISKEELPKVFHAFERLESRLKVKAGGAGLGLYLTKKLATEVLKGTVEAESEEGKGSTFRLRMPKDFAHITRGEES